MHLLLTTCPPPGRPDSEAVPDLERLHPEFICFNPYALSSTVRAVRFFREAFR